MSDTLTPSEVAYFDAGSANDPTPEPAAAPAPEPRAPPPEPAAAAEPAAPPPAKAVEPPAPKMVDLRALHDERNLRQAAEARNEQLIQAFIKSQPAPKIDDPTPPIDINRDPLGAIQQRFAAQEKELASFRSERAEQQAASQQMNATQQLQAWGNARETEFAKDTPDYRDAATHLIQARDRELALLGVSDPDQRRQHINSEVLQITAAARQAGGNPAETFYALAQSRGFVGKAAEPAPEADTEEPAAMATVRRGQQLASPVASGGSAPAVRLTAAALAAMPNDEFERALQTKAGRELMGG